MMALFATAISVGLLLAVLHYRQLAYVWKARTEKLKALRALETKIAELNYPLLHRTIVNRDYWMRH
jgi:hypothetical protein